MVDQFSVPVYSKGHQEIFGRMELVPVAGLGELGKTFTNLINIHNNPSRRKDSYTSLLV